MPLPNPGDILLGKYEITRSLGEGGMGAVFAASDLKMGDPVAVKFLHPHLAARPDVASRFLQEARAGRRIENAHVARVFDIQSIDDVPFIVMQLVEGETLAAYLERHGPLPIAEAVDLLLQACEAVNEAHTHGIVHRDIKPGNLFLTPVPNGVPFVRVLDFGISKFENINVTANANVLGTPLYMAPEQAKDAPNVDGRADVWSLGVVLYEMLSGTRPFAGSSGPAILLAVLQNAHAKLSTLRPDVPPFLERAVDRALAKKAEDRFGSVEELAAAIVQFGSSAGGASLTQIQRDVARSSRAPAASPALVPSSEGPNTAPGRETHAFGTESIDTDSRSLATKDPASEARTPEPPEPKPVARRKLAPALGVAVAAVAVVGVFVARSLVPTAGAGTAPSSSPSAPAALSASASPPAAAPNPCPAGATPECEAACTAKAPGACHALAGALVKGKGALADPARAATLYQAECESGGMAGCNSLGQMYAGSGDGVGHNDAMALGLYQKACTGKLGAGCVNLGSMHYDGTGVPKNRKLAASLYRQGCEMGEPYGCFNLSVAYASDNGGVPHDDGQAYVYADKACAGGNALGCVRVADAKLRGAGVDKDVKGGLGQIEAMCAAGQVEGCKEVASLYAKGLDEVAADPVRRDEYLAKACKLGDKRSCGTVKVDDTVARTSTLPALENAELERMCDAGQMAMCALAGENLIAGRGVLKDAVKGAELRAKACRGGVKSACGGAGSGGR
jgi:eukaryotic-like serine/threonine-protein kinase